jgi:hypothetical protein
MHHRLAVILATCVVFSSSVGRADESDTEARRKVYEQGRAAMAADRWQEGYRLFSGLWRERPSYDVAINLGEIELHLGKFRDAAEHLSYGVGHLPPREKLDVARTAREGLALAKQRVGTLKLSVVGARAELRVDGVVVGNSPLDHEVFVDPGSHQVEADSTDSGSMIRVVAVGAGQERTVELTFGEARAGAAPAASGSAPPSAAFGNVAAAPVPSGQTPAGANPATGAATNQPAPSDGPVGSETQGPNYVPVILTGAATAAGIGLGIAFLTAAKSHDTERRSALRRLPWTQACGAGNPNSSECASIADLANSAATLRTLSYVSFGLAGAAGVATFLLWPRPAKAGQARLRLVPTTSIAAGGLRVGVSGVF